LGGTGGDCEWLMSGKIPFSYLTDSKNELKMLKGPKCFICFKGIFLSAGLRIKQERKIERYGLKYAEQKMDRELGRKSGVWFSFAQ